jgi:hypothetical protein
MREENVSDLFTETMQTIPQLVYVIDDDDKNLFSPRCPRCSDIQDVNETMDHVLMCPNEIALEEQGLQWKATVQQIQ